MVEISVLHALRRGVPHDALVVDPVHGQSVSDVFLQSPLCF